MGITKRFNGTQLEQELTKPCPLMPDGEWVWIRCRMRVDENGHVQCKFFRSSDKIGCYRSDGFVVDEYYNNELELQIYSGGTNATNLYVGTRKKDYSLAECRMIINCSKLESVSTDRSAQMQASTGWYTSFSSDINIARDVYFVGNVNPTINSSLTALYNTWDDDDYIEAVVYAYVVPSKFKE